MAGKRVATSELNHDNWNQDDEPEDAGSFSKASDEVLKNRVIKVAKRRNPIGALAATEGEKKSIFANFSGFGKTTPNPSSATFGFLSNTSSKLELRPKTNGVNDTSNILKTSTGEMPNAMFKLPETKSAIPSFGTGQSRNFNRSEEYYAKIKGLNQSVSNWIKKHVDTNPFLNLTPIFRDYEKHLEEIENTYKDNEDSTLSEVTHKVTEEKIITSNSKTETQKAVSSFTFKPTEEGNKTHSITSVMTSTSTTSTKLLNTDEPTEAEKSQKFNFGSSSPNTSSTFSFGKPNAQQAVSSASFTFGGDSAKPFTFSNVAKPANENEEETEDAEDKPPKVEFKPVVEEGNIYTIRCRVFVKKDNEFADRRIGNLYLKPVPDKDKVQLIVRAESNLGNLLCNFILSKNIPMQRMGVKDVMLICLPMPDSKPPPVPVLIRVKSPEAADELLRTLEKHKK